MTQVLGILLALACALTTNVGFLFKHRGACAAPAVDIRHPLRSARALFASKLFAIGMLIASAAWIFHVAAMAVAPLSLVQAVLAGGVVLLAVMAERTFGLVHLPQAVGRHHPHRRRPAAARLQPPRRPRRPLALLGAGHDRLRGRPARRRHPAHHGPAHRRPRGAPRLHARRRRRNPVRRLRRRHQGHLGPRRRPRRPRPAQPLDGASPSSPRSPPSTPRPRACRTATPSRSSPSPAPPPTSRASSAGSSSSATRSRPTR